MTSNLIGNQIIQKAAEVAHEELLKRNATYQSNNVPDATKISRYVVLDVISDPTLVDENKIEFLRNRYKSPTLGSQKVQALGGIEQYRRLSHNTIIARKVNSTGNDQEAKFLLPFFPQHLSMPCNPGEHVWCLEESSYGENNDTLYWMCRIPAPHYVEDLNHTHSPRQYEKSFHNASNKPDYTYDNHSYIPMSRDGQKKTLNSIDGDNDEYVKLIKASEAKELIVNEAVPRYRKRPGDLVIQGSNNTLISLQTDRDSSAFDKPVESEETLNQQSDKVNKISKGNGDKVKIKRVKKPENLQKESGAIDIVAGRVNKGKVISVEVKGLNREESAKTVAQNDEQEKLEGDPDYKLDKSRIYLSQKTNVDKKLKIDDALKSVHDGVKIKINSTASGDPALLQKSDKVRIVGRKDISIIVTNDDNDVNAVITISNNGDILIKNEKRVIIKSQNVMIGDDGTQHAIPLGDKLKNWLANHTHSGVPSGNTGQPTTNADLELILSKNCFVKE